MISILFKTYLSFAFIYLFYILRNNMQLLRNFNNISLSLASPTMATPYAIYKAS